MIEILILLVFPAAMIISAAMDFFTMKISNRISLALFGGFFVLAFALGLPSNVLLAHIGAGVAMLGVAFILFCLNWIGGGDAKLFAVTALWLGWGHLMEYALVLSVFGGLLTMLLLAVRMWPLPAFMSNTDWALRLHQPSGDIPYGIALALAGLVVYPHTFWMTTLGI